MKVTLISGLHHLEGQTVSILADGSEDPQQVVVAGQVTLTSPAGRVHVGLPITAEWESLPLIFMGKDEEVAGRGRSKNIGNVYINVERSREFSVGASAGQILPYGGELSAETVAALVPVPWRTDELFGTPADLRTREVPVNIEGDWNRDGKIAVQQAAPLPFRALSLVVEVEFGD